MTHISDPNNHQTPETQLDVQESDPDAVFEEEFIPVLQTEEKERDLDRAFDALFGSQSVTDPLPENSRSDF